MKIYTASKTKHAEKWIELRNNGVNIISTWIDDAVKGEVQNFGHLCSRCIKECLECNAMIVYAEEGDYLKGAFIEMGIALTTPKIIILVGPVLPYGSVFTYAPQVFRAKSLDHALMMLNNQPTPEECDATDAK